MRKINLGIIGCGIAASELHYPALKKLSEKFNIVAVCNHTEKKAIEFSKMVGNVPYYMDYKDLLKNPQIEAVDITLPIELNYKVSLDAIKEGKHVFLEKPLAANIKDAKKLVEISRKTNVVCFLAENYRYDNLFLEIKKLTDKEIIGKVYSVVWNVFNNLSLDNKYAQTKWRQKNKYPGGFVYDGGVHNIAALRLLFGEFSKGYAIKKSINPAIGTDDTFSLNFEFENGINGVLNIYFSVKGFYKNELYIFGTKGSIIVSDNTIQLINKKGKIRTISVKTDGGFENEFSAFYNAIVYKKKYLNTFEEGYKDIEVLIKAFNGANGKSVVNF